MTIGERIRARRLLRGWSVRHAAGRAGVSHATWSRIERGRQTADNRFVLAGIAAALECSPADLAGEPVPAADRAATAAQATVAAIRQALVELDLDPADVDRPADLPPTGDRPRGRAPEPTTTAAAAGAGAAGRTLDLVESLRQACDYAGATRLLPDLLRDLHAAKARRMLCRATFAASSLLRNLGHPAEAWLAAERCRDAAGEDPDLQAYAAYARACAANACGSYRRGLAIAQRAAADYPAGPEMLGSLYLTCSDAARGLERTEDSREFSAEAATLARHTGETTTMGMYFGPTNVAIWRIGTEADPGRAAEIARETEPATIPARFRQVFFYADTARALSHLRGHDRAAIRFLLTAERLAPQHVHTSPAVRETTRSLLERSGGTELRGLAVRMHVS